MIAPALPRMGKHFHEVIRQAAADATEFPELNTRAFPLIATVAVLV
jgi:hypothetical protein